MVEVSLGRCPMTDDSASEDDPLVDWEFIRLHHNGKGQAILTLHGAGVLGAHAYLQSGLTPASTVEVAYRKAEVKLHTPEPHSDLEVRWTITQFTPAAFAGTEGVEIVGATESERYTLAELRDR